jgi:YegS/Rv2252/BmrU family lipid kinase
MLVILNPAARGGAGMGMKPEVERELALRGLAFDVVCTTAPGDATRLARQAAAEGVDTVVAVGGDGTVHETVNGLMQAADAGLGPGTALGIIPVGTGNDFVKVIPGTTTRLAAYETLARGQRYAVDVGLVGWDGAQEYFMNAMGTGIDVEVVRQIQGRSRRTGELVYIGALVRALRRYRPIHLRFETGGETIEERVMTCSITNGSCIGGLFRICPMAQPADGLLDLCCVRELSMLRVPRLAVKLIRGQHVGHADVQFRRTARTRITVLDGSQLFLQLDGEIRAPAG